MHGICYNISNMNERQITPESTIDQDHFDRIVQKVREVAPYEGQPVDGLGCYVTRYELPDVDVGIFVPTFGADFAESEEDTYDDAVRIIVRREEVVDENYLIWYIKQYSLHLADNEAEYGESVKVCDALTGRPISAPTGDDYETIKTRYELEKLTTSSIFTKQRYDEAMTVLDSLTPDQRF